MHKIIIGLSIIFFTLSGIITVKTLGIPVMTTGYQTIPEKIAAEPAKEQAVKRYILDERQDAIAKLKDKLSNKNQEFQYNIKEMQQTIAKLENRISSKQNESESNILELQTTIAKLERELSNRNEKTGSGVKTVGSRKTARVLAVLGEGTFSSGQVIINDNLMRVVKDSAREILSSRDHRVIIEGHTDNIPIRMSSGKQYQDNMDLSYLRAKAIAKMLIKQGIPIERISVVGYGDTRPIASNDTDEGRAKNRRVEVKLIPEDKES